MHYRSLLSAPDDACSAPPEGALTAVAYFDSAEALSGGCFVVEAQYRPTGPWVTLAFTLSNSTTPDCTLAGLSGLSAVPPYSMYAACPGASLVRLRATAIEAGSVFGNLTFVQ